MRANVSARGWAWAPSIVALAGFALAVTMTVWRPLEPTMPVYFELADRLRQGPLTESFEPLGYPWLIARMPFEGLETSAKALHVLSYAALGAVLITVVGRGPRRLAALPGVVASVWILFNPYVLVNLFRLNDNNVAVPALLGVWALVTTWSAPVAASALVGALALVRPNVVTLLPAVLWVAGRAGAGTPATFWKPAARCLAAAVISYVLLSMLIAGTAVFRPGNGGYNLFAGNNPATREALAGEYNAEPSLPAGLAWCGVDEPPRLVSGAQYVACTTRFVVAEPLHAIGLAAIKFYTLMIRPNLRLADSPAQMIGQMLMVVPSVAWWAATLLVLVRRRQWLDPAATAMVAAFALPFVLTNADPRLRLPLDPIFVLSLAAPRSLEAVASAWTRSPR